MNRIYLFLFLALSFALNARADGDRRIINDNVSSAPPSTLLTGQSPSTFNPAPNAATPAGAATTVEAINNRLATETQATQTASPAGQGVKRELVKDGEKHGSLARQELSCFEKQKKEFEKALKDPSVRQKLASLNIEGAEFQLRTEKGQNGQRDDTGAENSNPLTTGPSSERSISKNPTAPNSGQLVGGKLAGKAFDNESEPEAGFVDKKFVIQFDLDEEIENIECKIVELERIKKKLMIARLDGSGGVSPQLGQTTPETSRTQSAPPTAAAASNDPASVAGRH